MAALTPRMDWSTHQIIPGNNYEAPGSGIVCISYDVSNNANCTVLVQPAPMYWEQIYSIDQTVLDENPPPNFTIGTEFDIPYEPADFSPVGIGVDDVLKLDNGSWLKLVSFDLVSDPNTVTLAVIADPRITAPEQNLGTATSNSTSWARGYQNTFLVNKGDIIRVTGSVAFSNTDPLSRSGWWCGFYCGFQGDDPLLRPIIGIDWSSRMDLGPQNAGLMPEFDDTYMLNYTINSSGNAGGTNAGYQWPLTDGFTGDAESKVVVGLFPNGGVMLYPSAGGMAPSQWSDPANMICHTCLMVTQSTRLNLGVTAGLNARVMDRCIRYRVVCNGFSLDTDKIDSTWTNFTSDIEVGIADNGLVVFGGGGAGSSRGGFVAQVKYGGGWKDVIWCGSFPNAGSDTALWWFGNGSDVYRFLRGGQQAPHWGATLYSTSIFTGGAFIPGGIVNASKQIVTRNKTGSAPDGSGGFDSIWGYEALDSTKQRKGLYNSFGTEAPDANAGLAKDPAKATRQMALEPR